MATIRSYTTIEQSRKLNKILPLGSADMYYCYVMDIYTKKWDYDITPTFIDASNQIDICDIPCWSLAALLNVISNIFKYNLDYNGISFILTVGDFEVSNIIAIDACYEMILKLHEVKML